MQNAERLDQLQARQPPRRRGLSPGAYRADEGDAASAASHLAVGGCAHRHRARGRRARFQHRWSLRRRQPADPTIRSSGIGARSRSPRGSRTAAWRGQDSWTDARGRRSIHRGNAVLDVSPISAVIATAGSGSRCRALGHGEWPRARAIRARGRSHRRALRDLRARCSRRSHEDGIVHLWNVASRQELRRMAQGSASVLGGRFARWSLRGERRRGSTRCTCGSSRAASPSRRSTPADRSRRLCSVPTSRRSRPSARTSRSTAFWNLPAGNRAWEIPMSEQRSGGRRIRRGRDGDAVVIRRYDGTLGWWDSGQHSESRSTHLDDFVSSHGGERRIVRASRLRIPMRLRACGTRALETSCARCPMRDGSPPSRSVPTAATSRARGEDVELNTSIEVTEMWPDDPAVAAVRAAWSAISRATSGAQYLGRIPAVSRDLSWCRRRTSE